MGFSDSDASRPHPTCGQSLSWFPSLLQAKGEMHDANIPFSQQHPEIHSGGKPGSTGRSLETPDNKQEK